MGKLISEIPFSEAIERIVQTARTEGEDSRARGAYNDVYVRELPAKEDWTFLLITSALTCTDDYRTGNCTVNTQATAVTFSSDVSLDATFTGRQIKFTSNPNVYNFTYSNATAGTINPPLSGTTNISNGAYVIFQPFYALSENFDRFPKNGGVLLYEGGHISQIPEAAPQTWYRDYTAQPGKPDRCRLVRIGTDQIPRVELNPPPNQPYVLALEYLERLDPLYETTAGFVDINSGATTVTGSAGTTRFTEAQTGWYFRIDAFGTHEDSEWYRVNAITNNSSLTLSVAFGLTGATTARYTLSPAPRIPAKLHHAPIFGAVRQILTDQNDPTYQYNQLKFSETIADAKRQYKSRTYQQEVETVFEDYNYRR